jgi:sugar lactone lactonase YvrE
MSGSALPDAARGPVACDIIHRIGNFRGLWALADGTVLGMRGSRLLRFAPPYDRAESVASLPGDWRRKLGRARLLHRLLRLELYRLAVTPHGTIVATSREGLLRCDPGATSFLIAYADARSKRPISLCIDGQGRIYFGEYFGNPLREPVRIFMSQDEGRSWQVCYEFPAKSIRHVHGLIYDSARDRIWVMTGDYGQEAQIGWATPGFTHYQVLAQGSQQTRACDGICTPQGLIYATDTPLEQNHVYQLDAETGARSACADIQHSVLFMGQGCGGMFLSTIVEPSEANLTSSVHVWFSADGKTWHEVFTYPRDRWSLRYFQYPTASFAAGAVLDDRAFVSWRGTRGNDGDCFVVRLASDPAVHG